MTWLYPIRRAMMNAVIYLVFGVVWILTSDSVVELLVSSGPMMTRVQSFKGIAFVIASAVVIFLLVRRELQRVHRAEEELRRENATRRQAEEDLRALSRDLEQRVAQRTAQLEAVNEELEAFSYSVSHDLRAPLKTTDAYIEMLLDDMGNTLDPEVVRRLGVLRERTGDMARRIDDLLVLSRLGRKEMTKTDIDMNLLVTDIVDLLEEAHPDRRISFTAGPLPRALGDPGLVRVVLENLLTNAVKYTAPRGIARIDVRGRTENGQAVYSVDDNGVGFDARHADKVFNAFERLHSDADFEGSGIGLALVQRIVTRHGGQTWAEAEAGKGATFHFSLPLADRNSV